MLPTFSVQQHSLKQHRVLCDPLGHQQDAFWDFKPPHSAATSLFLGENKEQEVLLEKRAHTTSDRASQKQQRRRERLQISREVRMKRVVSLKT